MSEITADLPPRLRYRSRMKPAIIALVVLLGACSTQPITLRNSRGETVKCGPYSNLPVRAAASAFRESQCISDYQRQGYERMP